MRPIFVIALLATFAGHAAMAQVEGNATAAQESPEFPTLYKSDRAEVTTFGYLRAGVGWRDWGEAPQRCLQLPTVPVKYRLGNECEVYFEPGLTLSFGDLDGTHIDLQLRGSVVGTQLNSYDTWETFLVEAWAGLDDFAETGPLAGARIWAGQRFYARQDIHIHDFYYFNGTGMGIGIEEIPFRGGELAFTLFEHSTYDAETALTDGSPYRRIEARVENYTIGPATFRAALDLRKAKGGYDTVADYGALLSAEADISDVAQGTLTVTGQLGWGAGTSLNYFSDAGAEQGAVAARAIASLLTNRDDRFAMQTSAVLELQSRDRDWLSLGARPIWRVADSAFHIAVEPGLDLAFDDGETSSLARLTAALMWKPGGPKFFDRPSLRAYVSYSDWNGAAEDTGITPYFDGTSGTNIGLQLEQFY